MNMFNKVSLKSVVETIREQFLVLISEEKLTQGMKLPSEKELIHQLGVSRAALREAIYMMIGEDLLEVKPGLGIFIKQQTSATAIKSEMVSLLLMKEDLADIQEVRKILEPEIAALVTTRVNKNVVESLEEILRKIEETIRLGKSPFEPAWNFHRLLAHSVDNRVLTIMAEILYEMIKTYEQPSYEKRFNPLEELEEHHNLLEAIKGGNPEQARAAMVKHLDYIKKHILEE